MFLTSRLLRTNEHVKKEAATTGEVSFWPTAACRTGTFRRISMSAFDKSRHSKSTNLYTVRTAES
jgi:hypothetical protein